MRPLVILTFILALFNVVLKAQNAPGFSYQAILRYPDNSLIQNTEVGILLSIHSGNAVNESLFSEYHIANTNQNGLLTLVVGNGINVTGTFESIDWSINPLFLNIQIDPSGGENYTIEHTTQLLSVPVALYALNAGNSGNQSQGPQGETGPQGPQGEVGPQGQTGPQGPQGPEASDNQMLSVSIVGDTLFLDRGGFVIIKGISKSNYPELYGCNQPDALNYDSAVLFDDGSCIEIVPGCTEASSINYNPEATLNDSTCIPIIYGCQYQGACNYNPVANTDNNQCLWIGATCDDNNAATYDDIVSEDCTCNGILYLTGCTDTLANNFDSGAQYDDGSCNYSSAGCTYASACNYNPNATNDNGSCLWVGNACDDGNPSSINDVVNDECTCVGGAQFLQTGITCEPSGVFEPEISYGELIDIDGNHYKTINVNGNEWMAENLRASHYSNGDEIVILSNSTEWANTDMGASSWYDNDSVTSDCPMGRLYNWHVVADDRNVCPTGWHVPDYNDWSALIEYYGGVSTAGSALKSVGNSWWNAPNTADNTSGFSALPGGFRYLNGLYLYSGSNGAWWTSDDAGNGLANYQLIYNNDPMVYGSSTQYNNGMSVRCIRD